MEITKTKRAGILLVAAVVAITSIAATTGNLEWTQLRSDNRRGSTAGAIGQSACGSTTNGHMGTFDSNGCLIDGGAPSSGTVTSVGVAVPTGFTVAGSPVTSSGTITIGYASSLTTHQVLGTGSGGTLALISLTGADLPNPSSSTLGGVKSIAAVTSNWIDSISTSGVPHASQPAFSDISGTVAAAQLPTPTTSTFGGVKDIAAVAHEWIDSIVSGVPHLSQPAFSDLSGSATAAQLPTNENIRSIGTSFDGGGSALSGTQTRCIHVYYSGTIQKVVLIADQAGSATVDVKTVAYSSYTGPSSASSITASDIPALSSAVKYSDTGLTGWGTSISADTEVCFALSAPSTVTWVIAELKVAAN